MRTLPRPRAAAGLVACLMLPLLAGCGGDDGGGSVLPMIRSAAAQTPSTSAFQEATDRVLPAVVYIQVEARPQRGALPVTPRGSGGQDLLPSGAGSGVIFTEQGHILTNNHVVQQAERVTVTLYDRRQYEAEVVARDPSTDIAVVRIEGEDLPVAPLGDSDALRLGQWVLALGSPLGLTFTVTAGIVSGTERAIGILSSARPEEGSRAAPLEDFIQTDAAINPGNSGGPLVNLDGQVVGINSAIASPTGMFAGYGFAVPINLARRVAEQLIQFGEVRRPYLGVLLDGVDPVDAAVYELTTPGGAEIVLVEDGSPASRAGLRLGDVVVGIGKEAVRTVTALQVELSELEPGATVPLRVVRYGRELTLPIKLGLVRSGVRPERSAAAEPDDPAQAGFTVAERGQRVVVTGVRPYSPAARAGIRPGQEVVSINRENVGSARELVERVRRANGGIVSMVVQQPGVGRTIVNFRLR